jgi:hypothetical protein
MRPMERNTMPVLIASGFKNNIGQLCNPDNWSSYILIWHFFINDRITFITSQSCCHPSSFTIYRLVISKGRKEFHAASCTMKLVMLAGLLYAVVVKVINWNLL